LVSQFALPLKRKLKHLSRGQRMKAIFASSLAYRPSLIVLDEPFTGLDPLVRDELIEGLLERAPETTIFLSSHDLAEIESFSSHVGFLEEGKLLFSEELSELTDRFRDVTVTLAGPNSIPANWPLAWLLPQAADSVIRFVHSGYQSDATERELATMFPGARNVAFDPMPLRAIFLAIAKSNRKRPLPAIPSPEDRRVEA
jgi:ABC-2 type transport system ATP-binding protein